MRSMSVMPRREVIRFLISASIAAIAMTSRAADDISVREREAIVAVVRFDGSEVRETRPVVLVARTEKWMPPAEPLERPPGISDNEWEQLRPQFEAQQIPAGLREKNKTTFDLTGIDPGPRIRVMSYEEYRRETSTRRRFRRFVQKLGEEPLILSVSRPFTDPDTGTIFLTVHVEATWSGCGGVNLYEVRDTANGLVPSLRAVLVVW